MNERTSQFEFAELVSLKLSIPILLLITATLGLWGFDLALGFALGAVAGLVGAYFSWLHLRSLAQHFDSKSESQIQRSAFAGTLASVVLMGVVLALSAASPQLNVFATAAGLLVPKLIIGLGPFLRRAYGGDR